ncbi:hypothetical protein KSS87_003390, partial [Heliosperma pusillum]
INNYQIHYLASSSSSSIFSLPLTPLIIIKYTNPKNGRSYTSSIFPINKYMVDHLLFSPKKPTKIKNGRSSPFISYLACLFFVFFVYLFSLPLRLCVNIIVHFPQPSSSSSSITADFHPTITNLHLHRLCLPYTMNSENEKRTAAVQDGRLLGTFFFFYSKTN